MIVCQYFVEFIFYSFLGWVWESIYCTIKEKKWADRGFLFGPVCPIYGSCVVAVNILFSQIKGLSDPEFPVWGIFLISMAGSAIAEYVTSWVLEKRFHALWWDYSNQPFNLHGRICLPVSIGFGLAGIVVVKYLIPVVSGMHTEVHPIVYAVLTLIFALIFGADFALTEASLSSLLKDVENYRQEFNRKAEFTYTTIASAPKKLEHGMSAAKANLSEGIAQTKESFAEGMAQTKENFAESLFSLKENMSIPVSERVKSLADQYAGKMNPNQIRIMMNIKTFRMKEEEKKVSGLSMTEHLKNAILRRPGQKHVEDPSDSDQVDISGESQNEQE